LQEIISKWKEIEGVNQKFLVQLQQIFSIEGKKEREAMLNERVEKAVLYFGNQLIEVVLKPIIGIESKIKLYFRIAPLKKELEIKIAVLKMMLSKFEKLKQYGVCQHSDFSSLTENLKTIEIEEPISIAKTKTKQTTQEITLELFKDGMNVLQIAEARNLTTGTIYNHLFKLFEDDKIALKAIFSDEEFEQIKSVMASLPPEADYTYIKEKNVEVDYNIIRFWRKNQEKIEKNL
jgi:hypothetical protein